MNHKIYELAERAGAYCEVLRGGDYKPPDLTHMSLEKYTELIVQEVCWDMINSQLDKTKINRVAKSWGVDVGVKE